MRTELSSVIESGHEVIFYQQDLADIYKQAIPIVNLYNSRDHYCPTAVCPPYEQNLLKIKLSAHYLYSALQLFSKTDKTTLKPQEKNVLRALETDINHFKLIFKVQAPDTVETRTLTKSVGRALSCLIHPVPHPVPCGSSSLNPSGPEKTKHSKKHTSCLWKSCLQTVRLK